MRIGNSIVSRLCLPALVVLGQACAAAQSSHVAPVSAASTTIIVVRHAEKSTDDPRDPSLTVAGQQGALALSAVLKDAGVTAIYTTHYKRNRQTAEPLAHRNVISITERPISGAHTTDTQHIAHE